MQVAHQPILEGVRRFGCERKIGEFVSLQISPAVVIESFGRGAFGDLQFMDRPFHED